MEKSPPHTVLPKCPTGIKGLDEITRGGLPLGRPTLLCGAAGCGKTLMAMEFIVRGATEFNEPGVYMCFEETAQELTQNVRSLGFDLDALVEQKKLVMSYVRVERSEIEETGEYDLEGLFIRLGHAIDTIGAKRVVLDTIESLFAGLSNTAILRAELRRLFHWLKEKKVTAIITGERGDATLTRQGLEEYVSDCVIMLDHRVTEQLTTRRLRVVKYRGSAHGTNEYPFLIDENGIDVLPISSLGLQHAISDERFPSGIPELDAMLGGNGFYRGSSILLSGTAGTGKTTVASTFLEAACRRGERSMYFSFEESMGQTIRNMHSVGLDLQPAVDQKLLQFHATRPTEHGLEMHLATMFRQIRDFKPRNVVLDPATSLLTQGNQNDVRSMMMRMLDHMKGQGITCFLTVLNTGGGPLEQSDVGISSLIDTWLLVRDIELNGERNRAMYILKSRGMAHSNQIREFLLTSQGVRLRETYLGPQGVLTGSSRMVQEMKDNADTVARQQEVERKKRELERERALMETRIVALKTEFEAKADVLQRSIHEIESLEQRAAKDRQQMAESRKAAASGADTQQGRKK
ncbi:MAG TPA: circadian clock protein KaiC [Planctomycetota bacterium]|jgi:circadian clock protein KaiC